MDQTGFVDPAELGAMCPQPGFDALVATGGMPAGRLVDHQPVVGFMENRGVGHASAALRKRRAAMNDLTVTVSSNAQRTHIAI